MVLLTRIIYYIDNLRNWTNSISVQNALHSFFIFCWPSISSHILLNNQPDALIHVFIYSFRLSTCFEHQVLIIRMSNCINTSSGMISLCKWLGMPVRHTKQSLTQTNHTRWCINTIRHPDDEHLMLETCKETKWINKYMNRSIRLVINKYLLYILPRNLTRSFAVRIAHILEPQSND